MDFDFSYRKCDILNMILIEFLNNDPLRKERRILEGGILKLSFWFDDGMEIEVLFYGMQIYHEFLILNPNCDPERQ